MIRPIDDLSNLYQYKGEINWEEFFDAMEISEEQKDKRKSVADKMFFILLSFFVLVEETRDIEVCEWFLRSNMTELVIGYGVYDSYSFNYINRFSEEYVAVTFRNEGEYWTSDDRAMLGALNEANAICGYDELQEAIEDGCTFKIWRTERDNKVRKTHRELDGKKIPIDDYFEVGNERLFYPRDEVNCTDLSEISGCRCHLDFE